MGLVPKPQGQWVAYARTLDGVLVEVAFFTSNSTRSQSKMLRHASCPAFVFSTSRPLRLSASLPQLAL